MGLAGDASGSGAAVMVDAEETLPVWDLSDLYASPEDPRISQDLDAAADAARRLEAEYRGRLAALSGDGLAKLIADYEKIDELLGRVHSYASLLFAVNREDDAIGRFYQSVRERVTEISTQLLFVTLELNRLEEAALESKLAASALLQSWRPWIRNVRLFRPHQLDDEIERVLHEKSVTGRSAWVRLFDETAAALRFPLDGRELTSAEIFDRLQDRDRTVRQRAGETISAVLARHLRLFSRITNTLAKDKQIEDGWRKFPRPISARNLANQVEDEVVDALMAAVRAAYSRISHRYYTLKARWMGLERLEYWDRNAPLPEDPDIRRPWSEARRIVLQAFERFSPRLADILEPFFERGWIDAGPRPGKDSGAFCHPTVPSVHPYVLMNYLGRNRDIMTLAHELGHGVHQTLAAKQGYLMSSTPLTLAETASVFGEQLTFEALLACETDPLARRALLASKIEDAINTVIRQIAFCDFEIELHERRRQTELTPEEIGDIWMKVQAASLGPAFSLRDEYRVWWCYIPHFVHVPFYVYAYAFGECLVNSLYAVYRQQPEGFEEHYLGLLEAGGTLRYDELLAPFGLDARDPAFWDRGLAVIEGYIDQLAASLEPAA